MGADNVLEATIVTPRGEVLVANECQNSDIFFAIRGGGGGTYGVILEATIKAFPTPQTTSLLFSADLLNATDQEEYWNVVSLLHTNLGKLKDGGAQGYYGLFPQGVAPLPQLWLSMSIYNKPNGTIEKLFEPITSYLNSRPTQWNVSFEFGYFPNFWTRYQPKDLELVAQANGAMGSWMLSRKAITEDPERVSKQMRAACPLFASGMVC